jgi:hypothetical protein
MAPRLIASIVHIPSQVGCAVTARGRRSDGDLARTPCKPPAHPGFPVTLQGLRCSHRRSASGRPDAVATGPPGGRLAQLVRALP